MTTANTKQIPINYKHYYFTKGRDTLFLAHNTNHPINMKVRFMYGNVKVFTINKVYLVEIISDQHFSNKLDWTQQYFQQLLAGFKHFVLYRNIQDEDDDSVELQIKSPNKSVQDLLLKCKLVEDFSLDVMKQLWKCFYTYSEEKKKSIQQLKLQKKQLIRQKEQKSNEIFNKQKQNQENMDKVEGQLSALISEKIRKLRQLGGDYIYPNQQKLRGDMHDQGTMQPTIQGTLFQTTQDFYF